MTDKTFFKVFGGLVFLYLAVAGGAIYIAVHFLTKYW